MTYKIVLNKKVHKDIRNLKSCGLYVKALRLRDELKVNPKPDNSKELNRDLKGARSIRINLQHRLVYEIMEEEKVIKILSMWGHYLD